MSACPACGRDHGEIVEQRHTGGDDGLHHRVPPVDSAAPLWKQRMSGAEALVRAWADYAANIEFEHYGDDDG